VIIVTGETDYSRHLLLKLSGEVLGGASGQGLDQSAISHFTSGIKILADASIGVGLVIGGGNIFRGLEGESKGVNRVTGDYMGMMATIINALAMKDALVTNGMKARVFTPFHLPAFTTTFAASTAFRYLRQGGIAIFGGGTGNPFCTTDSAAALRAAETGAWLVAKGTKVDGVYTGDPKKDPSATKYEHLDYQKVIEDNLKVMDATAVATCRGASIPIFVFDSKKLESFHALARGDWSSGTVIGEMP
jgi:uridylate kinase